MEQKLARLERHGVPVNRGYTLAPRLTETKPGQKGKNLANVSHNSDGRRPIFAAKI